MNVLIVPQYSMRSYVDGKYSLLADGNLNIVLHQIFSENSSMSYTITVPRDHVKEDMDIIVSKLMPHFKCKIKFIFVDYGVNAKDNRTVVPNRLEYLDYSNYGMCISYFENLRPTIPWVLKMHMSKIKELDRPYADEFYDDFIGALDSDNILYADVLNFAQKEQVHRDWPQLSNYVRVNEQCLNTDFYTHIFNLFVDQPVARTLNRILPLGCLFFPFRISDSAYAFDRVKSLVAITDPNESASLSSDIIHLPSVLEGIDIKTILISMIYLIKNHRSDIKIPLYEDCELAVHQLILELAYMIPDNIIANKIDIERYTFR